MQLEDIHIAEASIDDAAELLAVQKAAFAGQALIYGTDQLPPLIETLESLRAELGSMVALKVCRAGGIIATVRYGPADGGLLIHRLCVAPEWQDRGIGKALMRAVEARCPAGTILRLVTGSKSARNIHVYTGLGYRITGHEATAAEGVELLHLEKTTPAE